MKLVKETDQLNEKSPKVSDKKAEEAIRTIIEWIGEDSEREGLKSTPKRVVKAFKEYFQVYDDNQVSFLQKTFTEVDGYDDMVIEKNISIQSHCEHHIAPISGVAHVAYIPSNKVKKEGSDPLKCVVETKKELNEFWDCVRSMHYELEKDPNYCPFEFGVRPTQKLETEPDGAVVPL